MALTIETIQKGVAGDCFDDVIEVTFDNSYPTGGESLTPADIGRTRILHVDASPGGGFVYEYDHDNSKLKAYTTNLSESSDGPLVEVADTSSALDTITTRLRIKGT